MCFTIVQKTEPKIRIAMENIICYKTVQWSMRPEHYYVAPKYEIGKMYYAEDSEGRIKNLTLLREKWCGTKYRVYEGIHSYRRPLFELYRKTLKCIIPKGTKYLYSKADNEYVSTKIKPLEVI